MCSPAQEVDDEGRVKQMDRWESRAHLLLVPPPLPVVCSIMPQFGIGKHLFEHGLETATGVGSGEKKEEEEA